MTTLDRINELLDTIDKLCNTLAELNSSKSAIIRSLMQAGLDHAKALADFQANISRILTGIDDCVKEIRKNIR